MKRKTWLSDVIGTGKSSNRGCSLQGFSHLIHCMMQKVGFRLLLMQLVKI